LAGQCSEESQDEQYTWITMSINTWRLCRSCGFYIR